MNFSPQVISSVWLWMGHIVYLFLLLWTLWRTPWFHLNDNKDTHVLLGSCLVLCLVWQISGGATLGMEFHLLLVTSITLMFGWQFSIICVSLAQLSLTVLGQTEWASYSLNTLCNGIVPVWITYIVYRLSYIWLPHYFFIYVYVSAFFGGALSMLASRVIGISVLLLSSSYTLADLGEEPMFIVVMLFPEAFINGFIMTVLVVYRPQWVSSFNDRCYLEGK